MVPLNGLSHLLKSPLASLHAYISIQKYKKNTFDEFDFEKVDQYIFSISNRIEFTSACFTLLEEEIDSSHHSSLNTCLDSFSLLNQDSTLGSEFTYPTILLPINRLLTKLISITHFSVNKQNSITFHYINPAPIISPKDLSYIFELFSYCCAQCDIIVTESENSFTLSQ